MPTLSIKAGDLSQGDVLLLPFDRRPGGADLGAADGATRHHRTQGAPMPDTNVVTIAGRLTAAPTIRYDRDGIAIGQFAMASKVEDDAGRVVHLHVTCIGDLAENVALSLTEGHHVTVTGRLAVAVPNPGRATVEVASDRDSRAD